MWEYTFKVTWEDDSINVYRIVCNTYWKAWLIIIDRWIKNYASVKDIEIINIQAVS